MDEDHEYIITGGADGKSRLNVLSEALYPYVVPHLKALGLTDGKNFLDVGCGGGNISLLASEMVGPSGRVVGVDVDDEIITLNRQELIGSNVGNVTYETRDVCHLDYHNQFDFAYARFLLSHLREPIEVLKKMAECVKPGGKVIVWDTHFSGHLCYPKCEAFESYVTLFMKAAFNNGHNPEIGPSLYSLFIKAGLKKINFDVIFPCFHSGTGKWMAHVTLDSIKGTVIKQGLAREEQINAMLKELEAFTLDETTIMSMPHIFRVWGEKE